MNRRGTFLAMVVMLTWGLGVQAQSRSVSELLQQGMYAEKTEGDLDKAIGLYEQILERAECTKTMEASATYHLGLCHLKKGEKDKAAQYFRQAIEDYPDQSSMIHKAKTHLKKLAPTSDEQKNSGTFYGGLYGQAPVEVWSAISSMYGQACARGGMKNLHTNSNIHLVNSDFISWYGGYSYYQNSTPKPISGRIRLSGTTYPHQKHYDVMGNVLNTEIVPDERPGRENYYHVYLNLPQTLPSGQYFPYGWAKDGFKKLPQASLQQDQYLLNMTNRYGSHELEVFYLIVPNTFIIDSEETPTETTMVGDYTICAWEKEVQPDENHSVMVTLSKKEASIVNAALDPLKAENLVVEGWKLLYSKKMAEAEEVFKEATVCNPRNDGAFQGLGRAQFNQGKRHHAQAAYKACIALNPKNFAALNSLGWIAHAQDQIDEAIAWWEKAVQASKGADKWSLSGLAQVYMERQEVDLAIKYYKMWLKVEPNNEQAIAGLAKAQSDEKQGVTAGLSKQTSIAYINHLIKELENPDAPRFVALNQLIEIGKPAIPPLLDAMKVYGGWQIPKALGAIGDPSAIGALLNKWEQQDVSPMKEVIAESLQLITKQQYGDELDDWKQWWESVKETYTPQATIQGFMHAALAFDVSKAMEYVAPDSHDYNDIKEIMENPEHPFYQLFKKIDPSVPVKVIQADISGSMCSAVWEITLKEDWNLGEKSALKAGHTFKLDGNLHNYGDKWLITGI